MSTFLPKEEQSGRTTCNLDWGVYFNGRLTAGVFDAASQKPRELLQVSYSPSLTPLFGSGLGVSA